MDNSKMHTISIFDSNNNLKRVLNFSKQIFPLKCAQKGYKFMADSGYILNTANYHITKHPASNDLGNLHYIAQEKLGDNPPLAAPTPACVSQGFSPPPGNEINCCPGLNECANGNCEVSCPTLPPYSMKAVRVYCGKDLNVAKTKYVSCTDGSVCPDNCYPGLNDPDKTDNYYCGITLEEACQKVSDDKGQFCKSNTDCVKSGEICWPISKSKTHHCKKYVCATDKNSAIATLSLEIAGISKAPPCDASCNHTISKTANTCWEFNIPPTPAPTPATPTLPPCPCIQDATNQCRRSCIIAGPAPSPYDCSNIGRPNDCTDSLRAEYSYGVWLDDDPDKSGTTWTLKWDNGCKPDTQCQETSPGPPTPPTPPPTPAPPTLAPCPCVSNSRGLCQEPCTFISGNKPHKGTCALADTEDKCKEYSYGLWISGDKSGNAYKIGWDNYACKPACETCLCKPPSPPTPPTPPTPAPPPGYCGTSLDNACHSAARIKCSRSTPCPTNYPIQDSKCYLISQCPSPKPVTPSSYNNS